MKPSGRTAASIAASLEQELLVRRTGAGNALPTVRQLAATLRVSPATVSAAYKLLRARGLVSGKGRQGTRVVALPIVSTKAVFTSVRPRPRDLSTGNPDEALLPPLDPALEAVRLEPRGYGAGPEHLGLAAFASAQFEADGIPGDAVVVLSGGLDAIERILREHLRAGDGVAIEDPSFPAILDLVSVAGYTAVPFALDDEGPVPAAVEAALGRGCRAIVATPRAQNPTGAALSPSRADELRQLLRRFPDVVLIENDHSGPVAGAAAHSLHDASHRHWAVVRSLSKFLGPDLRVAVVAGDEVTMARVRGRHALGARWVSHILQELAVTLWSDPANGRRIARAGEIYSQRRTAAIAALEAHRIEVRGRSGFNVWVPVRHEGRVVGALAEKGWAVAAGERFRIQSGRGIRITTSTLVPDAASRLAADLASALGSETVGLA